MILQKRNRKLMLQLIKVAVDIQHIQQMDLSD